MNLLQGIKNLCKKLSSDEALIIIGAIVLWIYWSIALSWICNCDISTCHRSGVICDWPKDGIPSKMVLAALLTLALEFLVLILGFLSVAVVLLYEKIFHRTTIGIKPNGDQQEPIGQVVIKPFNRISIV